MLEGHTGQSNADHVQMAIAGGHLTVRLKRNHPEVQFRVGRKGKAAELAASRLKRLSAHRSQLPPLPGEGSLEWILLPGPPSVKATYPGGGGEGDDLIPRDAWPWTRAMLTYLQDWIISPDARDRLAAAGHAARHREPSPPVTCEREQAPDGVLIPAQSDRATVPRTGAFEEESTAPADVTVPQPRSAPLDRASCSAAGDYRRLVEELDGMGSVVARRSATVVNRPQRARRIRGAVLARSEGRCENPQCSAPDFHALTDAGDPVLEVDHVHDLALGGADHPANMVALCPNCHAVKTRGRDRETLRESLADVARERHAAAWSRS
ncbi:HNH endonuclease signature motif containing protein [Streptomyces sp. NPDC091371]|uniref:HNH endonuclease signature motif containing protein n=1 Tax=Streptomyces sp. NPDC091371 TaxID=3155303 RepID=UPI00342B3315